MTTRKIIAPLGVALLAIPLALSSPASAWERGGGWGRAGAVDGGLRSGMSFNRWGNAGYRNVDFNRTRWGYGGLRSGWGYGRWGYAGRHPGWGYGRWGYGGMRHLGYGRYGYARRGWRYGGLGYGAATAGLLGGVALGAAAGYPYYDGYGAYAAATPTGCGYYGAAAPAYYGYGGASPASYGWGGGCNCW
jgi:hypothetical protein